MKIMIFADVAGASYYHVGEEAMLTANLQNLRQEIPQLEVVVVSADPKFTAEKYKVKSIFPLQFPSFSVRGGLKAGWVLASAYILKHMKWYQANPQSTNIIRELNDSDLLFVSGAGHFNSLFPAFIYRYYVMFRIAKILQKPIIISSQTIGPFFSRKHCLVAKHTLNLVNILTLRDAEVSRRIISELGVVRPFIRIAIDDAFFLPKSEQQNLNRILLKEGIDSSDLLIGISIHHWKGFDTLKKSFAKLFDFFISEMGAHLIFIPHLISSSGKDDVDAAHTIIREMHSKKNYRTLNNIYDPESLKAITGAMDLVLSTRYHAIVFATACAVPSLAIAYDPYYFTKINGLNQMLQLQIQTCYLQTTSYSQLIKKVKFLLKHKENISNTILERIKLLQNQYQSVGKIVSRFLALDT